jgi:YD repeat-containing protein
MMYRLFFLVLFSVVTLRLHAQNVSFTYDAAGNRITRVVTATKAFGSSDDELPIAKNRVEEHKVVAYPNPTQGPLTVEVQGYTVGSECEIFLFDAAGRTIDRRKITTNRAELDLENQVPGVYVLKVFTDSEVSTFTAG